MATISDASKKNVLGEVTETYENLFRALNPILYSWNNEPSDKRIHIGFTAEDMMETLEKLEIDLSQFCGCYQEEEDGNIYTGVNMPELIALNIHMIQKALNRIDELEKEVETLKG